MDRAELQELARRQAPVRIERDVADAARMHGIALDVGPELLLVALLDDFLLDGYAVLPLRDLEDVRSTDVDELHASWMRDADRLTEVAPTFEFDLSGYPGVFRSVRAAGLLVTAECEEDCCDSFVLGRVQRVNRKSVTIEYLDVRAAWDSPVNVAYDDLTRVTFGNRYMAMLHRHAHRAETCPACGKSVG